MIERTTTRIVEPIRESSLPGPFPVGSYAARLKGQLLQFARVQLIGEVFGVRISRARVYFELRDGRGALPCSMWCSDYEPLGIDLSDGMRVIIGGGCDYYPGSAQSSPSFTFAVTELRVEGEGDQLLQLQRLRRQLAADGLFEPQKRLVRPGLPRVIGVVTGESGKARDDVLAGLRRRGWGGRLVWAFAPVQDRHAAPLITGALRTLASIEEVEVVIVARGGGSLADLFAFCDESLCRTVALLRVPIISSVGHHTDHTLIDDVAAVACSTPTHAAEAAVPVDIRAAQAALASNARRLERHAHTALQAQGALASNARRLERHAHAALQAQAALASNARRLERHARTAVLTRARTLATLSRAPAAHVEGNRTRLHQLLRELRASARRSTDSGVQRTRRHALVLDRGAARAAGADAARRRRDLDGLLLALAAHDPERTLQRGYAIVSGADGRPITEAAAAREARELDVRFADGSVPVTVSE
jgi:exodeoxyribonuclease VII large subunit